MGEDTSCDTPPTSVSENHAAAPLVTSAWDSDSDVAMTKKLVQPDVALELAPGEDTHARQQDEAQGDEGRNRRVQPVSEVGEPHERGGHDDGAGPPFGRLDGSRQDRRGVAGALIPKAGAVEQEQASCRPR